MKIESKKYIKISEVLCGLDENVTRYIRFLSNYCEDLCKLYVNPKFTQLISSKAKSKKEREFIKEIKGLSFDIALTGDLLFKCNLNKFEKYLRKYEKEFKMFFEDLYIEKLSNVSMDMFWITDCSTITIDTYMDMFFKYLLSKNSLPKGFNSNPVEKLEQELNLNLSDVVEEFKLYKEMHTKRNLFTHNSGDVDLIAQKELNIKTDKGYIKLISSLSDIVKYTKASVIIIMVIMQKILNKDEVIKMFGENNIFKNIIFNDNEKNKMNIK